jgi:hypothetical protein
MNENKRTKTERSTLKRVCWLCLLSVLPAYSQELTLTPEHIGRYASYGVQFNDAGQLPLDPEVQFEGKPTWRYTVEPGAKASTAFLFFRQPLDLTPHLPGGHLEFTLKSTAVAEVMLIGVGFSGDWASGERYMTYSHGSLEWKTYRIPLRALGSPASVQRLALTTTDPEEAVGLSFWISNVKLVP